MLLPVKNHPAIERHASARYIALRDGSVTPAHPLRSGPLRGLHTGLLVVLISQCLALIHPWNPKPLWQGARQLATHGLSPGEDGTQPWRSTSPLLRHPGLLASCLGHPVFEYLPPVVHRTVQGYAPRRATIGNALVTPRLRNVQLCPDHTSKFVGVARSFGQMDS